MTGSGFTDWQDFFLLAAEPLTSESSMDRGPMLVRREASLGQAIADTPVDGEWSEPTRLEEAPT